MALWHWAVGALTLLAIVAAWSRIATMKESPKLIQDSFKALAKLFNGAFGY
jgi:hypothetical protein